MLRAKEWHSTLFSSAHAQSQANAGLPTDDPWSIALTETDKQQAKALAARMATVPTVIASSAMLRARETAEPLLAQLPAASAVSLPVHEFTYLAPDAWRGATQEMRRPAVERYWTLADPLACNGTGAESFTEFMHRVEDALAWLHRQPAGPVFIVSHELFIRAVIWQCFSPSLSHAIGTMKRGNGYRAPHALGFAQDRRRPRQGPLRLHSCHRGAR